MKNAIFIILLSSIFFSGYYFVFIKPNIASGNDIELQVPEPETATGSPPPGPPGKDSFATGPETTLQQEETAPPNQSEIEDKVSDLVVSDIVWSPSKPVPGEAIDFIVTIDNQGEGRADKFLAFLYADGVLQSTKQIPSIRVRGRTKETFHMYSCSSNQTIRISIDEDDDIPESDETNNGVEIDTSELYYTDLVVQNITWSPTYPSDTEAATISFTVKNRGNVDAGPSSAEFFVGGQSKGSLPVSEIPGGGSFEATFTCYILQDNTPVSVMADCYGLVPERSESNNINKVIISNKPKPDLVVSSITWLPREPSVIEETTFTVKVTNQGAANAFPFRLAFNLGDALKTSRTINSLQAGATAECAFKWDAMMGNHSVRAVADSHDEILEENESNNTRDIVYSGTRPVDLFIREITWSPQKPLLGEDVTFTVTVGNQGQGSAVPFQARCYFDGNLKESVTINSLSPGGSAAVTFTCRAESGEHTVRAFADGDNAIPESNENNNERQVTYAATIIPKPDLMITNISCSPQNPLPGDETKFSFIVSNQGNGAATPFYINCYVDSSAVNPVRVSALEPGEDLTESFSWTAKSGTHDIKVFADEYNQLIESNENNNKKEITVTVP